MRNLALLTLAAVALASGGYALASPTATPAPAVTIVSAPPAVPGMLYPITWPPAGGAGYTGRVFVEPGPPFPTGAYAGPKDNATVTLKANQCAQLVTLTIKPGGHVKLQAQIGASGDTSYHWLSTLPAALADTADGYGIDNDRIYAGFYDVITFPAAGHFTLDYASNDCPVAGTTTPAFDADATVVKITVT